jgi:Galactose oxidase, central domain/Kelch motif
MNRSTEPDFDQRIADWLEDEPNLAPRQALETVLAAYPSIPQRHPMRLPRRFPIMTIPIRIAAAAVIGVLAVGGAFYLTRPDRPAVGGPSPEPSASEIASAPANPSASPSLAVIRPREASWIATGDMIKARFHQTATLLPDGKVLVAGGGDNRDGSTFPVASAELYDPGTGSWTATGNMATVREGHTATLLPDGKVLVAGGTGKSIGNSSPSLASAELYDPSSGSWAATGNMNGARTDQTATLLPDGKVLVAGGSGNGNSNNDRSLASAELYDPSSGSWTATGNMAAGRTAQTATLLHDGKVLVAGGNNDSQLTSAELYDPGSGSWTASGNMAGYMGNQGNAASQTATLLPDGKVLVVGSTPTDATAPSALAGELYDPGSGSWTFTGPMMDGGSAWRSFHTATLLPNGKVLVAGGISRNGAMDSAELYDPSTGSWAAAGNMITGREGHTATLLPDGRVLVAGTSAFTELYDPGSAN